MENDVIAIGERRVSQRHALTDWPMWLCRNDGVEHEAVCLNLSDGGLAFESRTVLKAGEVIGVHLPGVTTDNEKPEPKLRAQIVYRNGDQYGASWL